MIATGLYELEQAPFAGATGRGVRVAVIDSGVVPTHPHIGGVAGGIHVTPLGTDGDYVDRIGHGTAVAAAIREKAPDVDLIAVRVFDWTLATTAQLLADAIVWAAGDGAHVINVSVGTPNDTHREILAAAVDHAIRSGAWVVSAESQDAQPMLPGVLPSTIGVRADVEMPRHAMAVDVQPDGRLRVRAAPFPRPIAGVPVSANLQGVSFAVANVTGFLARLRESRQR